MVAWHRFIPADFEYDFEKDKLAAHGVTFEEAVGGGRYEYRRRTEASLGRTN
jgi:hypothetical protein